MLHKNVGHAARLRRQWGSPRQHVEAIPPLPSALILARSGLQDSSCRGMFRNNGSSPNLKRLIEAIAVGNGSLMVKKVVRSEEHTAKIHATEPLVCRLY